MNCNSYCRKLHKRDRDVHGIRDCMTNCERVEEERIAQEIRQATENISSFRGNDPYTYAMEQLRNRNYGVRAHRRRRSAKTSRRTRRRSRK